MLRLTRVLALSPILLALAACSDDGGGRTTGDSLGETSLSTSLTDSDSQGSMSTTQSGDGDGDPTNGDGDGDPTNGDGDGDPSTTSPTTTATTTGDPSTGGPPKFDLGGVPDAAFNCANAGGGEDTKSYIWIANSSQSTVSKINTITLEEEARYSTRATPGNPSRTSVSLSGDAAVANRSGGVVKFYSNLEDCDEMANGQPGLQTSAGANDVLPFGQDDCMAWYTAFNYTTQRPLAWGAGEFNEGTCKWENAPLWTAGNVGTAEVVYMDGETGEVLETVQIQNVVGWAGLYGGAVDSNEDFWTVDHNWNGPSTLIRVNVADFTYDAWPVTGQVHYGLAVDAEGRAWLCGSGGVSRFNPDSETWDHLPPMNGGSALGGCMEDADGILWTSPYPQAQLIGVDTNTMQIVDTIAIPSYVHGVSIDFEGNVWGVEFGGDEAFRVNPETHEFDIVGGLVGAYTYSDMTGFALSAAGTPSG